MGSSVQEHRIITGLFHNVLATSSGRKPRSHPQASGGCQGAGIWRTLLRLALFGILLSCLGSGTRNISENDPGVERQLLLLAGDVEQNPGPATCKTCTPCGTIQNFIQKKKHEFISQKNNTTFKTAAIQIENKKFSFDDLKNNLL